MNKKIICIIPARKGSKRVKNKNFRKLGKFPLINYTFDFANLLAKEIKNIEFKFICSSDSNEAKRILEKKIYKNIIFHKRSKTLSGDKILTIDVVNDVLNKLDEIFDFILILQPTCPFRKLNDIKESIKLIQTNCDSVVSICSVGGHHPFRMKSFNEKNKILKNYIDQGFEDMRPIQDLKPIYIRSGSIYLTKINTLKNEKNLVGKRCKGIIVKEKYSINIDTEYDFKYAETQI